MGIRADEYVRNYGFRVEFKPGPPPDATHGKWKTFRGGGIVLHETAGVTTGEDNTQHHSLGTCEWENITLTGQVTKERKDMLQWYQDMVQKGAEGDCFRDVTLTWLKRDGADDRAVTWNECFLIGYSLTPLDGDEMDVECIETIEICTGYSPDYLGK